MLVATGSILCHLAADSLSYAMHKDYTRENATVISQPVLLKTVLWTGDCLCDICSHRTFW